MAQKRDPSQSNQNKQNSDQVFDLLNFKGIFFENEHQKYICPKTGAHFEPNDLCRRLNMVKHDRDKLDRGSKNSISHPKANIESLVIQKADDLQVPDDNNRLDTKTQEMAESILSSSQKQMISPEKPPRQKALNNQLINNNGGIQPFEEINLLPGQTNIINQTNNLHNNNPSILGNANNANINQLKLKDRLRIDGINSAQKSKSEKFKNIQNDVIDDAYKDKSSFQEHPAPNLGPIQDQRFSQSVKQNNQNIIHLKSMEKLQNQQSSESQSQNTHYGSQQRVSEFQPISSQIHSQKHQNLIQMQQQQNSGNQQQLFNKTMQHAGIKGESINSKSMNVIDLDYKNQALQKLDKIAQKIGFKDSERSGNAINTQQQQIQIEMEKQKRNSTSFGKNMSSSVAQNNQDSNVSNSFFKSNFQTNLSGGIVNNGSQIMQPNNNSYNQQTSYVLMPIEPGQYEAQKKKSKFNIKLSGAPPLYQQNSQIAFDQNKRFSTEPDEVKKSSSNIKDAYLQSAIEKYKQKRKQDMGGKNGIINNQRQIIQKLANSQQNNQIPMMSMSKSNFKSFDKTVYNSQIQMNSNSIAPDHNRSNTTIYNNQQPQFMQERTRNSKIANNMLRINQVPRPNKQVGNAYLSAQSFGSGSFNSQKNQQTSQVELMLQTQNMNSFGIVGNKKDIQGQSQLQHYSTANNHRKLNSFQGSGNNGTAAYKDTNSFQTLPNPNKQFSPERTKQVFHQRKPSNNPTENPLYLAQRHL
ncbi:UNKNOWN [Stylonychia lemnae]|uniref:Uncharacterized protein n=1 Tax=Stylonychia lemnae TaxID=5949 RepID=A0A078AYG3_STYLE|nr:UNKNOWN [Stylonychia lemnae]|eukprot:CDW87204.1 UNKNOWN [Stylonychia lemnae]